MSEREEVLETFFGKYSRFDVVRKEGVFLESAKFYVRKDGKRHRGPYGDLRDAVEAAKKDAK